MDIVRNAVFKGFVCYLIGTLLVYLCPAPYAYANPVGGNVSAGSATISTSGNVETITQKSQNAVIDWSHFNIGGKETTRFVDPNSSSLTVNRVHDMNPSQILGTLSANGNIVLINPNGVFFGQGSKVDVNGIIATTSDVKNSEVMAGGKMHFIPSSDPNASVENQGTITAKDAGLVGLVAPNVQNSGVITAKLGKVQLASGDSFTLDLYGDKLLEVGVSDAVRQQLVQNTGTIRAEGGTVNLTAAAGRSIVNSLIDVEGEIHAPTFQEHNGVISIYAEGSNAVRNNIAANKGKKQGSSTVIVSGLLDGSGYNPGEKGGNISVLADNVGIMQGATLDASGDQGGGNIKIGGAFHGAGTTSTALNTYVVPNSLMRANAITKGSGGNVAVWSDNYTNFAGTISARGGSQSGKGGFVETSGHQTLNMQGMVDASAPKGNAGTWLLDPNNLIINSSATTNSGSAPNWTAGGGGGNVLNTDINAALNGGTSVNLTASGSIEVAANIAKTSGADATLTLAAGTDVTIDAAKTISSTVGKLNVVLDADTGGSGGSVVMNSGSSITSNGGNIILAGGSNPGGLYSNSLPATGAVGDNAATAYGNGVYLNGAALAAGAGNIILNGTGTNSSQGIGVFLASSDSLSTTSGNIAMTGYGAPAGAFHNNGVGILGNSSITTNTGAITITGTAPAVAAANGQLVLGIWTNNSAISSTGIGSAGDITLTGTGASGGNNGGAFNFGVFADTGTSITSADANIAITGTGMGNTSGLVNEGFVLKNGSTIKSTGRGNITITGTDSTGDGNDDIQIAGTTNTLGSATGTGTVALIANTLLIPSNLIVQTTGQVVFQPRTPSTTIGVAGGAGTLQITSGILAEITAGGVVIGSTSSTGNMDIDAYTWNAPVTFQSGTGNLIFENGTQSSGVNDFLAHTGGNITIAGGATLSSAAPGNGLILAAGGNFINNAGAAALSAPGGRWLVYSTNPAGDTTGGLSNDFRRFSCTYNGSCPSFPGTGNGFLYSYAPTLTVTPTGMSITSVDVANLSGYAYSLSGYLGSDLASDSVAGSLTGTTNYSQGNSAGRYNINYSSGSLASALGYGFSYGNNIGGLTVTAAATPTRTLTPTAQIPAVTAVNNSTPVVTPATPVVMPATPTSAPSSAIALPGTVQQETAKTANVTEALSPRPQVPVGDGDQLANYYSLMLLGKTPTVAANIGSAASEVLAPAATAAPAGKPVDAVTHDDDQKKKDAEKKTRQTQEKSRQTRLRTLRDRLLFGSRFMRLRLGEGDGQEPQLSHG